MSAFDDAFEAVVGLEGGYSNNPNDSGGPTKFGITLAVARANGYTDDMHDMSLDVAKAIYKSQYWDLLKLDDVSTSSTAIAGELFDTGVNNGVGVAARYLQRVLSVMGQNGTDYPTLTIDSVIGPTTLSALRVFLTVRGDHGETVLLRGLNCLRGADYIKLAEVNVKNEAFVYGWLWNRIGM